MRQAVDRFRASFSARPCTYLKPENSPWIPRSSRRSLFPSDALRTTVCPQRIERWQPQSVHWGTRDALPSVLPDFVSFTFYRFSLMTCLAGQTYPIFFSINTKGTETELRAHEADNTHQRSPSLRVSSTRKKQITNQRRQIHNSRNYIL